MTIEELLTTLRKEESNHGPDHIAVAKVLNNLANAYRCLAEKLCDIREAKYNLQKAKESLERALVIKELHYGSDHIEVADTLHNMGNCFLTLYTYYSPEEYQKAKELLEKALAIKERYYAYDHVEVAKTLHKLGNAYYCLKDPQKAQELFEKALAIRKRHYSYDHIEVARLLNNLGSVAYALEDYQKAKELFELILPIFEKHYGSDHVKVARIALHNLGNAYYGLEDYHKAREFYERALAILERHYDSDHIEVAEISNKLGNTYSNLEDYHKAKELYEKTLIIEKRHYGSDYIEVARTLYNLGNAYYDLEDYYKAKELYEKALAIEERHYDSDHIGVAHTLNDLGNTYFNLEDYQKAKELYERVLPIFERHYGSDHAKVNMILTNLNKVCDALEKQLSGNASKVTDQLASGIHNLSLKASAYTSLHSAAKDGELESVKYLISKGTGVNDTDTFGWTPLHYVACEGHLEVAKFLIDKGADAHAKDTAISAKKPIHVAAREGHKNVIEFLLSKGANVNDTDRNGWTPLHCASQKGHVGVIEFLLMKGADIDAQAVNGKKLIHVAAQKGHKNVIEFLLCKGASVNGTDRGGWTPLHYAVWELHLEAAKFLIDKGADINMKNVLLGGQSIDVTRKSGHSFIAELRSYHEQSGSVIQSAHSHKEQQKAFLRLSKLTNRYHNDTDIVQVEQGLYLSAFKKRNFKVNGKCSSITCAFSQILFLGLDLNKSDLHKLFSHNLKTSAELYERLAQGKQISLREEREIFALSKLLDTFEQQLDSPTSSLPSRFIHLNNYKQLDDLSSYISGLTDNFAIHLVVDNHAVAIYRTGDTYSYFDSNVALITCLKDTGQLIKVVENGISSLKLAKQGLLIEHFDVTEANASLSIEQKQVLAKLIQTERNLLSIQDRKHGPINLNGKQVPRTILYDIGVKLYLDGASMLINADIYSGDLAQNIHEGKMKISANEYLQTLKNSSGQTLKDAVQVAQIVPFDGSSNEIKHAQQITNSIVKSQNDQKEKLPKFLAVLLSRLNKEPTDLLADNPATCLNDVLVNNKFEYRSVHRM